VNPRQRLLMFLVLGSILGIVIGVDVANESYGLAVFVGIVSFWIIVERMSPAPPDAWILALILIGYIVGNRGFAQIQPTANIPLLPAEATLLVAVPALVLRMTLKKTSAFRRDLLNWSILAWMVFGTIRLPVDVRRYGVTALRDFAMVYYGGFFFIAQAFGRNKAASKVLMWSLSVAFICLVPVVISIQISPDFLVDHLTLRGIPLIYQKSDLIATSLAAGFFWLWSRKDKSGNKFWLAPAGASLLLVGAMASPRAAMAGIAFTTLIWILTGRWRVFAAQVGLVASAAVVTLAILSFTGRDLKTSAPYSVYEHAVSIFDPSGTGTYINNESGDPGGNNQFRLIWWRDVIDETLSTGPIFGLGFGADLSTRFLADYDLLSDENFAARSPHSMIVTVFGRMGALGLVLWLAVSAGAFQMAWRLIRSGEPDGMGLASIVCLVWISAALGVVLEGPMGAVLFWSVLGLANSRLSALQSGNTQEENIATAAGAEADWPIAKVHASDT
jgi:hypothetical protein